MRVPKRGGDPRLFEKKDYYLSPEKFNELEAKLERLKQKRPIEAQEVKRLAEMGDFSENAGYQLAKGRLRGLNQRILDLEDRLKKAEIIYPDDDISSVKVGHLVTIASESNVKSYRILGGTETNPDKGIISHLSPLGSKLLNKKVGDKVEIGPAGKERVWQIMKIE